MTTAEVATGCGVWPELAGAMAQAAAHQAAWRRGGDLSDAALRSHGYLGHAISRPSPVARSARVVLSDRGREPEIDGRRVPLLRGKQYDVVKALLEAGPEGLSGKELCLRSGVTDAVNVLKRLAKLGGWSDVISLGGGPWAGYRIA